MVKRSVLAAFVVLAGAGLSGCITGGGGHYTGYSGAFGQQPTNQAILDGTIRDPSDWNDPPRRTARRSGRVTIGSVEVGPATTGTTPAAQPTMFSEEWRAREQLEDARIKSRMTICRGC